MLIEIAGPAGSGKSTLAERLTAVPGLAAPSLPTRFESVVALARGMAGRWSGLGKSTCDRPVIRSLARLDQWARMARGSRAVGTHFVVDQGPVFRIIQVTDRLGLPRSESSWWSDQLKAWSDVLDVVVYLDAPDEILLQRVADRTKHHRLQDLSQEVARDELARVRTLFDQALSTLEGSGVEILRLDSRSMDPSAMERALAPRLGVGR